MYKMSKLLLDVKMNDNRSANAHKNGDEKMGEKRGKDGAINQR